MDNKSRKLVERFIDGEKDLMSKLAQIDIQDDDDVHALYLKHLFADDFEGLFKYKAKVKEGMKKLHPKTGFKRRKVRDEQ